MSSLKLVVGNWKMNGLMADAKERVDQLLAFAKVQKSLSFEMVLCPPATLVNALSWWLKGSPYKWGGQDCHAQPSGAYTGNISAPMLKDHGCSHVILGHSERRQYHKETSAEVQAKAAAAQGAGLIAIICIGETDAERTGGKAYDVVAEQLAA